MITFHAKSVFATVRVQIISLQVNVFFYVEKWKGPEGYNAASPPFLNDAAMTNTFYYRCQCLVV